MFPAGVTRFRADVELMLGFPVPSAMKIVWGVVTPLFNLVSLTSASHFRFSLPLTDAGTG